MRKNGQKDEPGNHGSMKRLSLKKEAVSTQWGSSELSSPRKRPKERPRVRPKETPRKRPRVRPRERERPKET
jgi:hypothetical protein